ncbi:MAG: SRPBCC family protein [Metallosphaera yellowstonensis]|jgi:Polyketide cyclase / dehydrase and lipid transport.
MEVTYDFQVNASQESVREYLMNPHNLMKYVPAFKDLRETDDGWELEVKWLLALKMRVVRQVTRDEVTYLIKKTEGIIKVNSYLRFIVLPGRDATTVRLTFFYDGPFQGIAKRQAEGFYARGVEIFKADMEKGASLRKEWNEVVPSEGKIYQMRTVLAKKIKRYELESILEEAMIKSVDYPVVVVVSDGNKMVQMNFRGGDLESQNGDLESLGENVTVLVKVRNDKP